MKKRILAKSIAIRDYGINRIGNQLGSNFLHRLIKKAGVPTDTPVSYIYKTIYFAKL